MKPRLLREWQQPLPPPEASDGLYALASCVTTGVFLSLCVRYAYQQLTDARPIRWTWWYPECLDWLTPLALLVFTAGWCVVSTLSVLRLGARIVWQSSSTYLHCRFLGYTRAWAWEAITAFQVRPSWAWTAHTLPFLRYRLEAIVAGKALSVMHFEAEADALAALAFVQTCWAEQAALCSEEEAGPPVL